MLLKTEYGNTMKANNNFSHLHVHSGVGSMADSMANINDLFKKAAELGQSALAITDHGTIAGAFDARKASIKYGVKYIPGIEAYFVDDVADKKQKRRHIVLLASSEIGYRNLLRINYEGFKNLQYIGFINKVFPRIDWNIIKKYSEDIICLTACGSGLLSREMFVHDDNGEWCQEECNVNVEIAAERLKDIFGDRLYLELQPHNLKVFDRDRKTGELKLGKSGKSKIIIDQEYINRNLINVAKKLDIKMVATTDVHYISKDDAKIHDMLMAINSKAPLSDKNRHRYEVEEFYMKDSSEIINHFTNLVDKEFALELCKNSVDIAACCADTEYLDTFEPRFPMFPMKDEEDFQEFLEWKGKQKHQAKQEDHAFMRFRCIKGFNKKYGHLQGDKKKEYISRMMNEIHVLELRNFCSYMLITSDFITKAKEQRIAVGGRGSVGGSLVANLLDIHVVDPIQYGLLFERFHNIEKKAFPDIDTDFSPDGRDWVKKYITYKYGEEKVAHVSNLSRMTPKVIVKDIARSLELGGSRSEAFRIANKITDSIPDNTNSIEEAMLKSIKFREFCEQFPEIERYGKKLAGLERSYATHAGGIVISDIDLSTYVPLRLDKNNNISVQYNKNKCEALGLIKMDILGLEHLRIIDNTVKNARSLGLQCPYPEDVPLDDQKVWRSIATGETMCIFQMESPHMSAICKQIKPRSVEDLSLVNALGRPSALKRGKHGEPAPKDAYVRRRDGKEPVRFKYEVLRPALEETMGICVYEEQLAKLAFYVAGWNLNKADGLRQLTKLKEKGAELAIQLKKDFIIDGVNHSDLKERDIEDIWDNIIKPFSEYGFNKAHGILYSINGYYSAYYKYYFKSSFMAAVLKSEVGKASSTARDSNIRNYKKEAKRMGLSINAPDINLSGRSFTVLNETTIVTGLAAVKGVGEKAVNNIIEMREQHRFKSFGDFLLRTKSSLVRKNVIQPLAKAGCFDSLGITRKSSHDYYSIIRDAVNKHYKKIAEEGRDAWQCLDDFSFNTDKFNLDDEWDLKERLNGEQETLGEYISGSANDIYNGFFNGNNTTSLGLVSSLSDGHSLRTEAFVTDIKQRKAKSGKNIGRVYADCALQDIDGHIAQLRIWPDQWISLKKKISIGKPLRAICKINIYRGNVSLVLNQIEQIGA